MKRFFAVDFHNLKDGTVEHNSVVSSFEEFAELSCGRLAIITAEVDEAAWTEAKGQP